MDSCPQRTVCTGGGGGGKLGAIGGMSGSREHLGEGDVWVKRRDGQRLKACRFKPRVQESGLWSTRLSRDPDPLPLFWALPGKGFSGEVLQSPQESTGRTRGEGTVACEFGAKMLPLC